MPCLVLKRLLTLGKESCCFSLIFCCLVFCRLVLSYLGLPSVVLPCLVLSCFFFCLCLSFFFCLGHLSLSCLVLCLSSWCPWSSCPCYFGLIPRTIFLGEISLSCFSFLVGTWLCCSSPHNFFLEPCLQMLALPSSWFLAQPFQNHVLISLIHAQMVLLQRLVRRDCALSCSWSRVRCLLPLIGNFFVLLTLTRFIVDRFFRFYL